jgi:hypothetical protein
MKLLQVWLGRLFLRIWQPNSINSAVASSGSNRADWTRKMQVAAP